MVKKSTGEVQSSQTEDANRLRALFHAIDPPISQMLFGQRYGIGSQGMVWQYLNGHRPLNIQAATSFAHGLNCKVRDFSPTLAAQIQSAWDVSGNPPSAAQPASEVPLQSAIELLTLFEQLPVEWRSTFLAMGKRLLAESTRASDGAAGNQSQ